MNSPSKHGHLKVFLALLRPFCGLLALSAITGVVAGLATVVLLDTINTVLNQPGGMAGGLLLVFIGLCLISLVGRAVSDMSTNRVGQRLVATLRRDLAQRILSAPIDALERYRAHRLMPVLTQDVDMISDVAFMLASTMIAVTMALGCLIYLATLSLPMFLMLAVMLLLGVIVQVRAQTRGVAGFWEARDHEERLHKAYRALSEGAKELRMNRPRRTRVRDEQVGRIVERISQINTRAINTYVKATAFGSALFFLLIALILTWAAFSPVEPQVLSGFVLVLLFLKGPVEQIAGALPVLGRARVAIERIVDLWVRFETPEAGLLDGLHVAGAAAQGKSTSTADGESSLASQASSPSTREPLGFERDIVLQGVCYRYGTKTDARDAAFQLGPIDLEVRKGEILFVVGDNGSGKTTLIKLLLGLYVPSNGQLLLDGQPIDDARRDDYRQLFSTVFADFHLFEDFAAGDTRVDELPETARPYLERLEIAHKVQVENGRFSTLDLSTGQRKRLALVHAWLEGRPLMVFDEWAADQDPSFRQLFYTELLPELRAQGHTLVVISHDDRYFHLADRVVMLREGRQVQA